MDSQDPHHLPPRLASVSLWCVGANPRLLGPLMLSPGLTFLLLVTTNVVSIHTQVTAASATGSSSSAHCLPPPGGAKGTEAGSEPQAHCLQTSPWAGVRGLELGPRVQSQRRSPKGLGTICSNLLLRPPLLTEEETGAHRT